MKRADAFALVAKHGGKPREGVTRKTDVLVVGELGWPLLDDGRPSNSLAQAKSYGIPVTSERQFLEWVGQSVPDEQAKTYTARPARFACQAAAAGGRPAHDVRPHRSARRPLRLPRPRRGATGREPVRRRHRALDHYQEPERNPQMAARRAAVEPQAVSGVLRPADGRADAGAHRQPRAVHARRRCADRRRRGDLRRGASGRGGGRPRDRRTPLHAAS